MKRQKRIALINDITGFGRCSISVQQPIISAMKIQACAMPTAILSTHTKFPQYNYMISLLAWKVIWIIGNLIILTSMVYAQAF